MRMPSLTMRSMVVRAMLSVLLAGGGGGAAVVTLEEEALIATTTSASAPPPEPPVPNLHCDPCLDRPSHSIRVITHGSSTDLFWRQIQKGSEQAARDMRIQLLSFDFYDNDYDAMAQEMIQVAATSTTQRPRRPDALVVTIPAPAVYEAVQRVLEAGIPVFGMNSGYEVAAANPLGVLGMVAMDEWQGGQRAAETFLATLLQLNVNNNNHNVDETSQEGEGTWTVDQILGPSSVATDTDTTTINSSSTTAMNHNNGSIPIKIPPPPPPREISAVFVNHQPGNTALDHRFQGFRETLDKAYPYYSAKVLEVKLKDSSNTFNKNRQVLDEIFMELDCPDLVLLASSQILETVNQALAMNRCTLSQTTLVGTFDTSSDVYTAIALGKLSFAIDQQQYLQGMMSVIFATTYISTGYRLALSSENPYGFYASGPAVVTLENLPTDTEQVCQTQGFPVCAPGEEPLKDYGYTYCPCIERPKVTIAAVTHFNTGGNFGRAWIANMEQAALDANIDLRNEYFQKQSKVEFLYSRMASKILAHCQAGVQAIIVTVTSKTLLPAIEECINLNIPVIAKNGGPWQNLSDVVYHIGPNNFQSFYAAGKKMIAAGMKQGACFMHVGGDIVTERCAGFEAAIAETNGAVEYLGVIRGQQDCQACFVKNVEADLAHVLEDNPNMDGVGLMILAPKFVNLTLELQEAHPGLMFATSGSNAFAQYGLASGKMLFAMDLGNFMQGYIPIWLATILATTKMRLAHTEIETGPIFSTKPKTQAVAKCENAFFPICPPPVDYTLNQLEGVRPIGYTLVSIVYATALICCAWLVYNRKHPVVSRSQPEFLYMISFGAMFMASAIIPLGIDDSMASIEAAGRACMAIPWCAAMGFTIMFAGIFSKIWRINRLMTAAKRFRRTKVQVWHVVAPLVALSVGNIVLLSTWSAIDPMYYSRDELCGAGDHSSVGTCKVGETNVSVAMLALVAVINAVALVLANLQAYKSRWVSEELSESKYIFINMVGMLQVGIMGIPLILLLAEDPVALYFLMSVQLFLISESTLLLMFVPKVFSLRFEDVSKKNATTGNDNSSWVSGMSGGSSRRGQSTQISGLNTSSTPAQLSSWTGMSTASKHRPSGVGNFMSSNVDANQVPSSVVRRSDMNLVASTSKSRRSTLGTLRSSDASGEAAVPRTTMKELERRLREDEGVDTKRLFEELNIEGIVPASLSSRVITAVLDACDGDEQKANEMRRELGIDMNSNLDESSCASEISNFSEE